MHPILVEIGGLKLYSYGFMIMLGLVLAFLYMRAQLKKVNLTADDTSELFLIAIVGVVLGGKIFYILEDPKYHLSHMKEFFASFGQGFVFYGSFLCTIPLLVWWFKRKKLNVWEQMDNVGIAGALVHGIGKIGCLMAGCCHGLVCQNGDKGIVYSQELAVASPKGMALYPTQIWDSCMILGIVVIMLLTKKSKLFHGQLFLTYGFVYAIGRFITEKYRGDESRGFMRFGGLLPDGLLSHSQFIAILIFLLCIVIGIIRYRKAKIR